MSKIIVNNCKIIYEIKKSIFVAYSFKIFHKEEVKNLVQQVKNQHNDASHICYGWRLDSNNFGFYDAGEPKGSAGQPIFKILEHQNIVQICVIIARYFGGTKLGVGPLSKSYLQSTKQVLEESKLIDFTQKFYYKFSFNFSEQKQFWTWLKQIKLIETTRKTKDDFIEIYFETQTNIDPPHFGKLEKLK